MSTLKEKNSALLAALEETQNPSSRGLRIGFYLRDARADRQVTLYEQYLLETERLSLEHQACVQPGWADRVGISHLVSLLNMKMMALLFQEKEAAEMWDAWGMEAYRLNQEKRPHYILDDYPTFLQAEKHPEALEKLLTWRKRRRKPFSNGPYHDEHFPYDLCAYEEMLLEGRFFRDEDREISGDIEDLLTELYLLQE